MSTKTRFLILGVICGSLSALSACKKGNEIQSVTAKPVMQAVSFGSAERRSLSASNKYYLSNLVLVNESSQCPFPQSEAQTDCIRNQVPEQFSCYYTGVVGCWGNDSKYICMFDCVELKDVEVMNANN